MSNTQSKFSSLEKSTKITRGNNGGKNLDDILTSAAKPKFSLQALLTPLLLAILSVAVPCVVFDAHVFFTLAFDPPQEMPSITVASIHGGILIWLQANGVWATLSITPLLLTFFCIWVCWLYVRKLSALISVQTSLYLFFYLAITFIFLSITGKLDRWFLGFFSLLIPLFALTIMQITPLLKRGSKSIKLGIHSSIGLLLIITLSCVTSLILNNQKIGLIYNSYRDLGTFNAISMTLTMLAFLPNLIFWFLGFCSGAGIFIGQLKFNIGSKLTGELPAIPLFAALPNAKVDSITIIIEIIPLLSFLVLGIIIMTKIIIFEFKKENALFLAMQGSQSIGRFTLTHMPLNFNLVMKIIGKCLGILGSLSIFSLILCAISLGSLGEKNLNFIGANIAQTPLFLLTELSAGSALVLICWLIKSLIFKPKISVKNVGRELNSLIE